MKIKINIQNINRATNEVGFSHSVTVDVCDPEENFIQHQDEIAEAIRSILPNITAGANYLYWCYVISIEKADD